MVPGYWLWLMIYYYLVYLFVACPKRIVIRYARINETKRVMDMSIKSRKSVWMPITKHSCILYSDIIP